jgi:hypothetical protein
MYNSIRFASRAPSVCDAGVIVIAGSVIQRRVHEAGVAAISGGNHTAITVRATVARVTVGKIVAIGIIVDGPIVSVRFPATVYAGNLRRELTFGIVLWIPVVVTIEIVGDARFAEVSIRHRASDGS